MINRIDGRDIPLQFACGLGQTVFFIRFPSKCNSPDLVDDENLISRQELERARRFRFPEDYCTFVTAHALLRRSLSRFAPIAPKEWCFSTEEFGRPIVAESMDCPGLHFNLSHTRELVACVVSREGPCGIDVETIGRVSDPLSLAENCFHSMEIDDLKTLEGPKRNEYFAALWCLKEAYLKAEGVGLSRRLNGFGFRMGSLPNVALTDKDPCASVEPTFVVELGQSDSKLQFRLLRPCETHFLAIALNFDER